jgi:wobble nucleotide-excising tRNase
LIVSSSSDGEGENAGNGVQDMPLLPPLEDEEEAALQAILTESESDEENARPAQRVYTVTASGSRTRNAAAAEVARQAPSLAREPTVNNNAINAMLVEARATIANKNAKIAELETTLDQALDNMRTALEARNLATGEQQIVEAMLRQRTQELKEAKDEITKLKEEKKGLSRTLRSEVARVGELNTSNRKLLDEITLLKQYVFLIWLILRRRSSQNSS